MLLSANSNWQIIQQDCIEHIHTMPDACVDFTVFSPPFPAMYSYTSKPEDIGNSEGMNGKPNCTSDSSIASSPASSSRAEWYASTSCKSRSSSVLEKSACGTSVA